MAVEASPVAVARVRVRLPRNAAMTVGLGLTGFFVLLAALAPLICRHSPIEQFSGQELTPPSAEFWFGTDHLGRDLFSRVVYGTRSALQIGVIAVALGGAVGTAAGVTAGYLQGATQAIVMRGIDALFAVPALILGITFAAVFGASSTTAALAIGTAAVPVLARLTAATTLTVKDREYVQAARISGAGGPRIIFQHVLPNIAPTLLVQLAVTMGSAILISAGLSFLGLGTQPPEPSWGQMLGDSLVYASQAPWFGIFPGVTLTAMVLGLNSLADSFGAGRDRKR